MELREIQLQNQQELLKDLTDKELIFATDYMRHGNGPRAMEAVDPHLKKESMRVLAHKMLKSPRVQAFINLRRLELTKKVTIELADKMHKLWLVVERAIPEQLAPVEFDENGRVIRSPYTPEVGVKALAELNKIQGHYAPERSIQVDLKVDSDIAQLKELIQQYKKDY